MDDDRITRAASSVFSANPVELALRTADRLADLSLTGRTPANPVGVFAHALIRLNDAQRADLIGRLRATADRRRYTALPAPLAVNMTLLSFKARSSSTPPHACSSPRSCGTDSSTAATATPRHGP